MAVINDRNKPARQFTLGESAEFKEIRAVVRALYENVVEGKPFTDESKEQIRKIFKIWEEEAQND